ncbi:MAG: class I SAM-dependent methyltransferase [Nocardioidaceae bacterium]
MDAEEQRRRASSFGSVAHEYAENRPDYPADAVAWLSGGTPANVLELGSGTGKLTRALLSIGHRVVATDPSTPMLAELARVAPGARRVLARAEEIPLAPATVDVVVSAQAFHWFDGERALPEIARVLRPGGVLANVWNSGDFKVPWVRRLFGLIGHSDEDPDDPLAASELFTSKERRVFRHWQRFDRESLVGFVASGSYAAVQKPAEREVLLGEVAAIYDSYGRGHAGMLMPWKAVCFRAMVTKAADARRGSTGQPDDGLLIDVR